MKYVGSKGRLSKDLKPIIQSYITENTVGYLEPFVGGANMIDKIECNNKIGCDIHKYLIAVLNELSKGWIPPEDLNETTYKDIQKNYDKYPDYLVGYAGFQLSYGGKWFGGYRRDKVGKRNYAMEAYKNTIKQIPNIKDIKFICKDFRELPLDKIKDYVIYCDIPYRGTTKYHTNEFPYKEFYEWVKASSVYNKVLISEYNMPEEFTCIWQKEVKTLLDSNKTSGDDTNTRVEKLFTYNI
jgi:DNA adenine methylase